MAISATEVGHRFIAVFHRLAGLAGWGGPTCLGYLHLLRALLPDLFLDPARAFFLRLAMGRLIRALQRGGWAMPVHRELEPTLAVPSLLTHTARPLLRVWAALALYGALRATDLSRAQRVTFIPPATVHLLTGPTKTRAFETLVVAFPPPVAQGLLQPFCQHHSPAHLAGLLAQVSPRSATQLFLGPTASVRLWRKLGARLFLQTQQQQSALAPAAAMEALRLHLRHANPASTAHYLLF